MVPKMSVWCALFDLLLKMYTRAFIISETKYSVFSKKQSLMIWNARFAASSTRNKPDEVRSGYYIFYNVLIIINIMHLLQSNKNFKKCPFIIRKKIWGDFPKNVTKFLKKGRAIVPSFKLVSNNNLQQDAFTQNKSYLSLFFFALFF